MDEFMDDWFCPIRDAEWAAEVDAYVAELASKVEVPF